MLKAFKYRLYPNVTQTILLKKTMGCVRYFWNCQVAAFNSYDKETNSKIVFLTSTQIRNENEWMKEVSAAAIQQKEIDFKKFRNQRFKKDRKKAIGRPKFKKRGDRQSFRLPSQKFAIKEDRIRIEKIGCIKFVKDRSLPEECKFMSVTISMDICGSFFGSVLVQTICTPLNKTGKSVGIDVGLKEFATLSNGETIANPKYFRENQAKLRKAQKNLSRKKKASSRRKKAKLRVARLHRIISNQRKYFLHKISNGIIKEYDVIYIENLNVIGMIKNRKLAKSIADASFSEFFFMLQYKGDWYGKEIIKIDRFAPSSKTCSNCGNIKEKLELRERTYHCENCGMSMDRDKNAAKNIKAMGVNIAKRA